MSQDTANNQNDIFAHEFIVLKNIVEGENFNNMSIKELETLYKRAESVQSEYRNLELTVKKDGNSLYGSSGNEFFSLVNYTIATDITNTGKHFTVIVDWAINKFLVNWGEDELKIIQEFYPQVKSLRKFTEYVPDTPNDACIYGDTDSRYIDLGTIYNLMLTEDNKPLAIPPLTREGDIELADFGVFLTQKFLNKIIADTLKVDIDYRQARHGFMKMTHEVTARKSIYRAKKNYVMPLIWKDGKMLSEVKLKTVGVEMQKGGLNPRIKKILKKLVNNYIIDGWSTEQLRVEMLKLIKYISSRAERKSIYQISAVSNLKKIVFDEETQQYKSDQGHIQMKMAIYWMNFIHRNNLKDIYKPPFEGQKMYNYYDLTGQIVAVPDDVDIDSIKGLPQPDYPRMLKAILVKNILRYISTKKSSDLTPQDVNNFLAGIQEVDLSGLLKK